MLYAPIIIPTLNRASHLERCLESLKNNIGAEHTDIYISVDYPPAQKYMEGYQEVKKLLETKDLSCFKNAYIFFHEENLGPVGNSNFLKQKVENDGYDRYIYTEDDNEFSPNFLQYMNGGLEKFKDNENVIAVCGAKDTNWETKGKNFLFCKLLAAYGVGEWINKCRNVQIKGREVIVPNRVYGPKTMFRLLKNNACLFNLYVMRILCEDKGFYWPKENELRWCDSTYSIYMHLSDAVCIAPYIAKSRTWGNDGSGVNMKKQDINPEEEWKLDNQKVFEYDKIDDICFYKENYSLGNKYLSKEQGVNTIKAIFCYLILVVCGGNRFKTIRILNKFKKLFKKEI